MQVAQSSGFNSKSFQAIMRYADPEVRHQIWANRLIDDQNGKLLGNANGSLHYEDHKLMLQDVVLAREYVNTAWNTLIAVAGVKTSVSIYDTLVGYMNTNQFNAQTSMDVSDRQSQQSNYEWTWVPQPIVHSDFHIPWRQKGFSYKQGDGITAATRAVEIERDKNLILGNTGIAVSVIGVLTTLTGLINSPGTLLQPASMTNWALQANLALVFDEAITLIATMFTVDRAAQMPNSVLMFVANDIFTNLERIVAQNQGSNVSNIDMLKRITAIRDVIPNQHLPDGSVLLVEATPEALRIPMSQDTTIAPWQINNQMEAQQFTVFNASTLQVREDRNGRSGVSFATKA